MTPTADQPRHESAALPPSDAGTSPHPEKICFVGLEPGCEEFFGAALPEHELISVETLDEVPPDAGIISVFIHSVVTPEFLDQHRAVRLVTTRSTAFDHLDLPACAQRGVAVCGVASYGDHTVAEHAFALLLALARRLREALDATRDGKFSYEARRGVELHGKTLGIIGAGRIGRAMTPIAQGFGMEVITFDSELLPGQEPPGGARVPLDELLQRAHFISLHAQLNPETYHLLDRARFARCRRGVLVINTARGQLIDTEALIEAMDQGIVAGVGLDVLSEEKIFHRPASAIISNDIINRLHGEPGNEPRVAGQPAAESVGTLLQLEKLLARPDVVFTPHTAFNTVEAIERINRTTVESIRAFLAGHPVNLLPPVEAAGPAATA